jgi:hypothetical protein
MGFRRDRRCGATGALIVEPDLQCQIARKLRDQFHRHPTVRSKSNPFEF